MTKFAFEEELVRDDELIFEDTKSRADNFADEPTRMANRAQRGSQVVPARDAVAVGEGDILARKYYVERVIGRAGLAVVLRVRHVDLGSRFMLKYLPPEACSYPDAVARFLRGARGAFQLQSEHTARTVDAGRLANGAPFVVSEYLAGSDLHEVLRIRGALSVTEAVDFVLQACEAVAEAHFHGMVHGSLSLSQVFVTRRPDGYPTVKVVDFGVAEALRVDPLAPGDAGKATIGIFGADPALDALTCASPEQVRRRGELDARADIWALGCVLHELLSGFPAFHADSLSALLAMIVADAPTPLSALRHDVPRGIESIVLRCLEKNRDARFPSLADLAAALKPFASLDAQGSSDRITRTLGRNNRPPPLSSAAPPRALVHIGPAPSADASALTPPPSLRFQLVWSTALVAFGLVGGVVAGAVLTRGGAQPAREQVVTLGTAVGAALPASAVAAVQPPPIAPLVAPTVAPAATIEPQQAALFAAAVAAAVAAAPPPSPAPAVIPPTPTPAAAPAPRSVRPRIERAKPSEEQAAAPVPEPSNEVAARTAVARDLFNDVR